MINESVEGIGSLPRKVLSNVEGIGNLILDADGNAILYLTDEVDVAYEIRFNANGTKSLKWLFELDQKLSTEFGVWGSIARRNS